jgi:hypothetical protein
VSDEPYTNLDLETADAILIAAGHGEIARALKHQTHGNRNLIQGEWGMKVVKAFENILQVQVVNALADVQKSLDQQYDLVQQILAMQKVSDQNAKRALAVAKETARGLKKLEGQMKESQADRRTLHQEVAGVKNDVASLRQEIEALKQAQR